MLTRRRFLFRSAGAMLGLAGAPSVLADQPLEKLPDGSAAKGMITAEAERAIEQGLAYLRNKQDTDDGSFGTNAFRGNVAVTSLAALAMMAGGHVPGRGRYGKVVSNALNFVLNQEVRQGKYPGYLYNRNGAANGPMYGHGFGALFLAEVHGMVHDPRLRGRVRETLERAIRLILDSQNPEGGWRYHPAPQDADISVTICQIMALRSARNAGIAVPKSTVDKCVEYVKKCQNGDGSFRYMIQGGGPGEPFARTAAGVAALYSAGIYESKEITKGLEYLKKNRPRFSPVPDMQYFYGHYYAVQTMWTAGGSYWSDWFPAIRDELLASQRKEDGSWMDRFCPHYSTAMACIILQIPNNYLPILQK